MSDQYNDNQARFYDSGYMQDSSLQYNQQYEDGTTEYDSVDSIFYSHRMEPYYSDDHQHFQSQFKDESVTDKLSSFEHTEIIRFGDHKIRKFEDTEIRRVEFSRNDMDNEAEFHKNIDMANDVAHLNISCYTSEFQNSSDSLATNETEPNLSDNDAKLQRFSGSLMANDTPLQTKSETLRYNNEEHTNSNNNLIEKDWYDIYSNTKLLIQRADELSKNNISEAIYVLENIQDHILSLLKSDAKPLNNASLVNRIKNLIQKTSFEHNKENILQFLYLCLRGHLLYEIEDFEEALECYEKFENLLPEDIFKMNVKRAKGDCLRKMKRYKDALKEYKHASKVENDYYSVKIDKALLYNSRGLLYMDNERPNKALFYFTKALKLNENPLYYCNKAIVFLKLGRNTDALKALEEASKLISPDEQTDKHTFYIKNVLAMILIVWSCNEQFQKLIDDYMNLSDNGIDLLSNKHKNSITSEHSIEELKSKDERRNSITFDKNIEESTTNIRNSLSSEISIEESIYRNKKPDLDKRNSSGSEKSMKDPIIHLNYSENFIKDCSKFMKYSKKFLCIAITTLNQDNDISLDAFQKIQSYELKMKAILKQLSDRYQNLDLKYEGVMDFITTAVNCISNFNKQFEEQRTKLEEYVTQIETNIKKTLQNYNHLLENHFDSSLPEDIKEDITEYYKAFVGTLLSAYCSAQVRNFKWVEKRKNLFLSFISDFSTEDSNRTLKTLDDPLNFILSGIVSVFQKLENHDGGSMSGISKLAQAYDELNNLLLEDILKVVKDKNKQKQISTITMDELKAIPDPFLKRIIYFTGFPKEKIEEFLDSMIYNSAAERLGYKDAQAILEKYVQSNEFSKDELQILTSQICGIHQSHDINEVTKKVTDTRNGYQGGLKKPKDKKFVDQKLSTSKKLNNGYETDDIKATSYQKYWYEDSKEAMNLILELRLQKSKLQEAKKKICQRAVKGYWNETKTRFNHKSCFELFNDKYLQYKIQKRNHSQLKDEEIEKLQMALFNFMCTAIANNEMKNLDCVTSFSKDYFELVEKIAEQYPQYFVTEKIVKAATSLDKNLQDKVILKLNEIKNDLDNNKSKDNECEKLYQEDGMERWIYKSKETMEQLLEFELEVKLCRRAIKGYWNESKILFSHKSCKELFDKNYLTSKLKKMNQTDILDEEIEELQMAMFNFMCTAIVNSKNMNLNCITGFANDYPELLEKIANQHPIYFVNQQVVTAAFSTDKNLQIKVISELNEANNNQDKNVFLYDQGWYEESNEAMDQLVKLRLEKSGIRHAKVKLCKRAVKGLWKEAKHQSEKKSCKELIDKKYLQSKLKKQDQSIISEEELEEVQMALFNFMCTSIVNYEKKKMDCITNFAKDYKELVEKIAEEHLKYFVNRRVIEAILSSDNDLQSKLLHQMNF